MPGGPAPAAALLDRLQMRLRRLVGHEDQARARGQSVRTRRTPGGARASSGGQVDPATRVRAPARARAADPPGDTARTFADHAVEPRIARAPGSARAARRAAPDGPRPRRRSRRRPPPPRSPARAAPARASAGGRFPALTVAATSATVAPAASARVASSGQRSSLANTRRSGASAASRRSDGRRQIVGQVVGRVHREAARQRLGGGTEVGVEVLGIAARAAAARAARSPPAAPRRRTTRETRPAGGSRRGPARAQAGSRSAASGAAAVPSRSLALRPAPGASEDSEPDRAR